MKMIIMMLLFISTIIADTTNIDNKELPFVDIKIEQTIKEIKKGDLKELLISQLKTNQFLSGGLLLGLFASLGLYFKKFPVWVFSRCMRLIRFELFLDENDDFYKYFNRWLKENYDQKLRNAQIYLTESRITSDNQKDSVSENCSVTVSNVTNDTPETISKLKYYLKPKDDSFIVWYKGCPLKINKGQDKLESAKDFFTMIYNHYSISGLFAKKKIYNLIEDVLEYADKEKEKIPTYDVYMVRYSEEWSFCFSKEGRHIDSVVIKEDVKNKIIYGLDVFIKSEKWYNVRGIPYQYTLLFHGSPGTGKSSLINALANKYLYNVYYLSLSNENLNDDKMLGLFSKVKENSLLVMEDIDSIFKGRKNISKSKITFSGFINALDGIVSKHNLITIMTTNHTKDLDPALTRAGRIDEMIKIDYPELKEIETYYNLFFNMKLGLNHIDNKNVSMAEIQKICMLYRNDCKIAEKEIKQILVNPTIKEI